MKTRRLFLPLLPLLAIASCATHPDTDGTVPQDAVQANEESPISAADRVRFNVAIASTGADANPASVPVVTAGPKRYVVLHLEFMNAAFCAGFKMARTHVLGRYQKFADLLIEADNQLFQKVARTPGLYKVDIPGTSVTPPPAKLVTGGSRATPEQVLRGGLQTLTGKGVVVAVVDSGVDFRHPDFIVKDARGRPTSRILGYWDTTTRGVNRGGNKAPVTYPNGRSFGTVYTNAQLTAELRSRVKKIPSLDTSGHGTACAGIAAGNGMGDRSRRYIGVAPEADIIAVRIGGASKSLPNTYLLGPICDWIAAVAKQKPYVVSCSFGGQVGGRDGMSVFERQIDARFPAGARGRAICVAAGNEAEKSLHQRITCTTTRPATIRWKVAGRMGRIAFYADQIAADIRHEITPRNTAIRVRRCFNRYTLRRYWEVDSPTGTFTMKIWTKQPPKKKAPPKGKTPPKPKPNQILFKPPTSLTGHVYGTNAQLLGSGVRAGMQIGMPGTARQAITVGSYDFNDQYVTKRKTMTLQPAARVRRPMTIGALSKYSNPGPRRQDKLLKPELTAPGQFHVAAAPTNRIPFDKQNPREASGNYRAFNGTSAATPYCAGVIALMLQKNPKLTVKQIRDLLTKSCASDSYTGKTPNPRWGHGKLSLPAIRRLLRSVPAK